MTDELGARLPELELTFAATPIPGAAFTLVYQAKPAKEPQKTQLALTLSNQAGVQLVNRTLTIQAGDVAGIREVAVYIEGVIRRQADSLADMVAAHAPKPPPAPTKATLPLESPHFEADISLTLGTLFQASRSTLGLQGAIRWVNPAWLSPAFEVDVHTTGTIENGLETLRVTQWTIGPTLNLPVQTGDIALVALAGPALTIMSSEAQTLDERFAPSASRHFTLRLGGCGEWKLNNNISVIGNFRLDFSSQPPIFVLRDTTLMERGAVLISFGAGLRFALEGLLW